MEELYYVEYALINMMSDVRSGDMRGYFVATSNAALINIQMAVLKENTNENYNFAAISYYRSANTRELMNYHMMQSKRTEVGNILVVNEGNKVLAKLLQQFGVGVYTILSYDIRAIDRNTPTAVIENKDGTPTTIFFNKEKGEWE